MNSFNVDLSIHVDQSSPINIIMNNIMTKMHETCILELLLQLKQQPTGQNDNLTL